MKMDTKLHIFTLNCWGICGVSRHRKERMAAIADHLANSKYDFVFLQEVWSQDDYKMIHSKTSQVLPYSFYFHSGVMGSGVCILSQSVIIDVAQYKFSLNGYAHKILHGDWFGGKVVGLCKVNHRGLAINLYVTHLHAEYDSFHDTYLPHRIAQAFEMSQFVRMTSESADLSIVAGDLNTEPSNLPYRIIVHNGGCVDTFLKQPDTTKNSPLCATCGHPNNLYTTRNELKGCPNGKRIDYIMYRCGRGTSVNCLCCYTPLGKIPDLPIPYSDHEAVVAELHVFKAIDAPTFEIDHQARFEAISSSQDILLTSMKRVSTTRLLYLAMCVLLLLAVGVSAHFKGESGVSALITLMQVLCSIGITGFMWMALVMTRIEYNGLLSVCKSMRILTKALASEYGLQVPKKDPLAKSCSEISLPHPQTFLRQRCFTMGYQVTGRQSPSFPLLTKDDNAGLVLDGDQLGKDMMDLAKWLLGNPWQNAVEMEMPEDAI